MRLPLLALLLGIALLALKLFAWWWTNSNAILSDALESIINVVAGSFALYSLWLAGRPRDRNHPYGHGKIEFISAGFEGALIFLAGLGIIVKASYNLFYPQAIAALDVGIVLTAVAGALNFFMGVLLERRGRNNGSLTLVASGQHLKSDAWSSLGLILGLVLVLIFKLPVLDSLVAIAFGFFILFTGFKLVRRSVAGIMDEADYGLIRRIVEVLDANRRDSWIDVHNLRTIEYGAELHIDCHLTLPWYFDNRLSHAEVKAFEKLVNEYSGREVELFIHVDPCDPPISCRICAKADCAVRLAPHETRLAWTLDNVMENRRHE